MTSRIALATLALLLAPAVPALPDPMADLVIDDAWTLTGGGRTFAAGSEAVLHALIVNDGVARAEDFRVRFYIDGELFGVRSVESLESGDSRVVRAPRWTATPGDHEFRIKIQTDAGQLERDGRNNERVLAFTVRNPFIEAHVAETAEYVAPYGSAVHDVHVRNLRAEPRTVALTASIPDAGWAVTLSDQRIELAPRGEATVQLIVRAQPGGSPQEIVVTAIPVDAPAALSKVTTRTALGV